MVDERTIVDGLVQSLEKAWNAGDGAGFGDVFTEDADFVAIRGDLHHGRAAVAAGHQAILDTIYRGSTISYRTTDVRSLPEGVVIAHVRSTLEAPTGPLAGAHDAVATLVVVDDGGEWRIAAFHNTLVVE